MNRAPATGPLRRYPQVRLKQSPLQHSTPRRQLVPEALHWQT